MYQLLRIILLSSIVVTAGCNGGTSDSAPVSTPGTSPTPIPAPGGDVGVATELDANTGLPSTRPALGMAAGGDAIAVWQIRESTGRLRVVGRRYTSQGWDNLEFLDVVTPANQNAATPHIAMNASGQAVVAWVQSDSTFNSTSGIINDVGSIWVRNCK